MWSLETNQWRHIGYVHFLYTVHGNHVAVAVKLAFYPLKPKS